EELRKRHPIISRELNYFRGKVGKLNFATEEFQGYFGARFAGFCDNWCLPVIQAPAERMTLQGIRLGDSRRADDELARVWDESDCDRGSSEAFAVFMAARWAYALVHPGASPDDRPRVTWESPLQAIVDRDPVTGEVRAGLVMWIDDEADFATLYLPTEVWKW